MAKSLSSPRDQMCQELTVSYFAAINRSFSGQRDLCIFALSLGCLGLCQLRFKKMAGLTGGKPSLTTSDGTSARSCVGSCKGVCLFIASPVGSATPSMHSHKN